MSKGFLMATLFLAFLLVGAIATVMGLTLPSSIQAYDTKYLKYIIVLVFILYGLTRAFKKSSVLVACLVLLAIALLTGNIWPVSVAIWFTLSSISLGRFILIKLRVDETVIEPLTAFLVGAGVFATIVGLLAHFEVNYAGVYGLLLAVPLLSGWRYIVVQYNRYMAKLRVHNSNPDWLVIVLAAVATLHFCVALLPEVGFDALAVHLFVPSQLALRHQWGFDPGLYSLALIPMLGDWVYSIGYMLAGETASRLLNVEFVFVMALLGRELVLWAGGSESGAKWAALLFLSTPLTYTETNSLFVESIWSAYMVAGSLWFARFAVSQSGSEDSLKLSGVTFGLAAAAKAVTLANLPVFVLLLVYRWRSLLNRKIVVALLVASLLFLVLGAIPYVTAWVISGNPVFPFFNEFFKSPFFPAYNFDNSLFKSGVQWDLPYRMLFDSGKYLEASNGASGFQWLLLLLPALFLVAVRKNYKAILLFLIAVSFVVMTFQSQSYMRYIFPSFLILSALIGVAISSEEIIGKLSKVFLYAVMVSIVLNLLFITSVTWAYRGFPSSVLWSNTARDQYLESRLPIRRAVEFVNYLNAERAPVAFFSQPFGAGLNADALYPNWYNSSFSKEITEATDAQAIVNALSVYGSNIVMLNEIWGTPEKRKIIEEATVKIAEFGSVSVRTVSNKYLFIKELIDNPELSGSSGWTLSQGASIADDGESFLVSVSAPATQTIKLRGGARYINEVTARCASTPGQGRIQINWHDEQMQFITASIKVYDCSADWQVHQQRVIAPRDAAFATVYGASHTNTPIEITRISLR